jgi:hypothetical protein
MTFADSPDEGNRKALEARKTLKLMTLFNPRATGSGRITGGSTP